MTNRRRQSAVAVVFGSLMIMSAPASAQAPALDRGSRLIGGSIDFRSTRGDDADDRFTSFNLLPSLQYFVAPGLGVGAELEFSYGFEGDLSRTTYGIGPILSYYFVGESKVHPFVRGAFHYSRMTGGDDSVFDLSGSVFTYRGSAGLLVLLSDAIGLDISAFYERNRVDQEIELIASGSTDESDSTITTFGLAIGVSAFWF